MSRSKLSVLSSSTVQLEEPENVKSTQSINKIQQPSETPSPAEEEVQHLPSEVVNNRAPSLSPTPLQDRRSEERMDNVSSSFQEDLISHFERRLSDLGPRSKYPYLQQLDRRQALANSLGSRNTSTSKSEEMLSRVRIRDDKKRGKWWKYSNGSSVGPTSNGGVRKGGVTRSLKGVGTPDHHQRNRHHHQVRRQRSESHVITTDMTPDVARSEDFGTNL